MFKLFALVCIFMLQRTANAAQAILNPVEKPPEFANQTGCYVPEINKVIATNTRYSPQDGKSCLMYACKESGVTIIESCSVLAVGKNCELIKGNKYLPYPDCCNAVDCFMNVNDGNWQDEDKDEDDATDDANDDDNYCGDDETE